MKKLLFLSAVIGFLINSQAQSLTYGEIYDYEEGDVFQWKTGNPDIYYFIYHTDTVINKTWSPNMDTVHYLMKRFTYAPPFAGEKGETSQDTVYKTYTQLDSVYRFNQAQDDISCLPPSDTFYAEYCSNVWKYHSNFSDSCFEPITWYFQVIQGAGGPYNYMYDVTATPRPSSYQTELLYWKKGDSTCGRFYSYGMEVQTFKAEDFTIYPNPSIGGAIEIRNDNYIPIEKLILYSINGVKLKQFEITGSPQINLNQSPGLYLIRILDKKGNSFSQKLVIK